MAFQRPGLSDFTGTFGANQGIQATLNRDATNALTNGLLGGPTFRANAAAAGLPANFWVANPDMLNGANLTTNAGGGTRAHSMQFEYRKRYSGGLAFNTSYTWSKAQIRRRYGFNKPLEWLDQAGQVGNVQHALKGNVNWEIPIGRERRFGANLPGVIDAVIGGWSIDGVARVQTGETLDFGNVRLIGMSKKDLQQLIKVQQGPSGQMFILPDDILQNTVKAFSVSATSASGYGALGAPTGRYFAPANGPDCIETAPNYGDCGLRSITVNGPLLARLDLGISKKFPEIKSLTFEFRAEMLNALNQPYFSPANNTGTPLGFTTSTTNPGYGGCAGKNLGAQGAYGAWGAKGLVLRFALARGTQALTYVRHLICFFAARYWPATSCCV